MILKAHIMISSTPVLTLSGPLTTSTTNKSSTLILALSGPLTTSTTNNNDRLHAVMMLFRLIRFLTQKWIISPQTIT